jgi:hypothetical protein
MQKVKERTVLHEYKRMSELKINNIAAKSYLGKGPIRVMRKLPTLLAKSKPQSFVAKPLTLFPEL